MQRDRHGPPVLDVQRVRERALESVRLSDQQVSSRRSRTGPDNARRLQSVQREHRPGGHSHIRTELAEALGSAGTPVVQGWRASRLLISNQKIWMATWGANAEERDCSRRNLAMA